MPAPTVSKSSSPSCALLTRRAQEFEPLLKEVVTAKRLSASKISKLTDIALKGMENDTQLVSILYRTHKSLPASSKVSSLYVFDALSRAARSFANKNGIVGDIQAPLGNCATFLLKVEGVLDGLIQDLMSSGAPEAQEKTRKILDIWTKGATFPPHVLARLTELTNKKKGAYPGSRLSAKYHHTCNPIRRPNSFLCLAIELCEASDELRRIAFLHCYRFSDYNAPRRPASTPRCRSGPKHRVPTASSDTTVPKRRNANPRCNTGRDTASCSSRPPERPSRAASQSCGRACSAAKWVSCSSRPCTKRAEERTDCRKQPQI
ncbi:hypothetical protein EXIGLDRAFT_608803 [Exidia glandulosa HHB12029]|uniref:CID domain-containing protein n=1 Tax=Exidia glandulosa HHB12029 TaxID=1314781 RepID=A0A165KSH9_EXIGL|nr:hypothetical protein EXIGLDRAFT_608803 [Exidia glandulosa HHB12029]